MVLVPPRRGWIVDRNGQPIAINRSDYRVDLIPDQLKEPERIVPQLAQLLELPGEEVERIFKELDQAAGYQPVAGRREPALREVRRRHPAHARNAGRRSLARLLPLLPGRRRGRPSGRLCRRRQQGEYAKEKNPLLITPGFKIGKEGLEEVMEPRLRGKPGAKRLEVTARGKLVRELSTLRDQSGGTLPLTIDAGLQAYAARRMGNESGSCVVIDCWTGDILCMASMPSYDPNSFSDGIGQSNGRCSRPTSASRCSTRR
jgi:penicillin-binding protein 2